MLFNWIEIALLASMAVFMIAWFRFRDIPGHTELHEARSRRR